MTDNWSKQSIVDAYNSGRRDFSREDFSYLNLSEICLVEANLTRANLTRAVMKDADLRWVYLTRANLTGADLTGADLTGADIDFSVWPLWCGSLGVKVDKKIAAQLMYHACALDCDDPEYQKARANVLDFANQMHSTDVKRLK